MNFKTLGGEIMDMYSSIPKSFPKNILTNQMAVRIAAKCSDDLFGINAKECCLFRLRILLKRMTNRSDSDCKQYLAKIPDSQLESFIDKARKFVH